MYALYVLITAIIAAFEGRAFCSKNGLVLHFRSYTYIASTLAQGTLLGCERAQRDSDSEGAGTLKLKRLRVVHCIYDVPRVVALPWF